MTRFFFCSVIVLASCCWSFAQERQIDEVSYNALTQKATSFLSTESFRTRTIVDECEAAQCIWRTIEKSTTEVENPDRRRLFGEVMSPRGFEPLSEYRIIDDKEYRKQPSGDWKIQQRKAPATGSPSRSGAKIVFMDLGTEGDGVDQLRVVSKITHVRMLMDGAERESVQTIKSWIDRAGRFRQQEYLWTDSRRTTRRTISYKVDPSIRIEAPIK